MTPAQALTLAGVPQELHAEALASVALAKERSSGLTLAKWRVRLFKAGKIAEMLQWNDDRLCFRFPQLADWDVAPMENITAHGDNGPWHHTPAGDRPDVSYWLNSDPASGDYLRAVASNYWLPGTHPRSKASRKAWYRRNAGEFRAYRMGAAIDPAQGLEIWRGSDKRTDAVVWRASGVWIIKASRKLIGPLRISTRVGFEVDNVYSGDYTPQMWWPAVGYELRACVTWSVLPAFERLSMEPKRWERPAPLTTGGAYTHWMPNA